MLPETLVHQLEQVLQGLQYGSVHLVIHDSQVVRIERIERVRLAANPGIDLQERPLSAGPEA